MHRKIILLLLLGHLFFGLGVIAIEPPFEGFDETAHFSRLQSQAFATSASPQDAATRPDYSKISTDVYDYYRQGPMPYGWILLDELHKDDPVKDGYSTYYNFFQRGDQTLAYISAYRTHTFPAAFTAGPEGNWQYQHPPLYYLALAPIFKQIAGHTSLATLLLILRSFSYLLATAGLGIGVWATAKYFKNNIAAVGLLYPLLFPAYYSEFARLGNDSLCLFLFGICWAALLHHIHHPKGDGWFYVGLTLSLSCLTKVTMVPVSLAVVGFLFLHHFKLRHDQQSDRFWWLTPLKTPLFIALPIICFTITGNIGAGEFHKALTTESAVAQFIQNFTWNSFVIDIRDIFLTASALSGGWSRVRLDLILIYFYSIFGLAIFAGYLVACYRNTPLARLSLWVYLSLAIGLVTHSLIMFVTEPSNTFTPGYYIHSIAPVCVVIFGYGLMQIMKTQIGKIIGITMCAVAFLGNIYNLIANVAVYSGCLNPLEAATNPHTNFHFVTSCALQPEMIYNNLNVLGWPDLAIICIASALICFIYSCRTWRLSKA